MKTNVRMLKKALSNLSNDLDVLYDDALLRIESQHHDDRELAEKALRWIAYSFVPLSASELQEALAIQSEEIDFDVEAVPSIILVLDVCAGLLVHDRENGKIHLVHYTAQDYFDRLEHSKFREAHPNMARDCITYLSYECFQSIENPEEPSHTRKSSDNKRESFEKLSETFRDQRKFYFLTYATFFWARHARVRQDVHLSTQLHHFLQSSPRIRLSLPFDGYRVPKGDLRTQHGFEIAAFFGFIDELKEFIQDTENPGDLINRFELLYLAVKGNQSTAIEVLLDLGADIEGTRKGTTPLLSAIGWKFPDAAATLIDRGADVMAVSTKGFRQSAITSIRSVPVAPYLKPLLEAGARVRTEDIFEYTSLMDLLMKTDDVETAENLFKLHAGDSKAEGKIPSMALSIACGMGATKWVEMLLRYSADIDNRDQGGSPGGLRIPFSDRRFPFSLWLRIRDFNLNMFNLKSVTPLMLALQGCHEECSFALLRQGADVNLQEEDGFTALHIAAAIGSLSMTDQLVKYHALVHIRSTPMYTLKYLRSEWDFPDYGRIYYNRLMHIDVDQKTRILISRPIPNGKEITYLLRHQKPVQVRVWENGMTALDIAILRENEEIVRLLRRSSSAESEHESGSVLLKDWLYDRIKASSAEKADMIMDAMLSREPQPKIDDEIYRKLSSEIQHFL